MNEKRKASPPQKRPIRIRGIDISGPPLAGWESREPIPIEVPEKLRPWVRKSFRAYLAKKQKEQV